MHALVFAVQFATYLTVIFTVAALLMPPDIYVYYGLWLTAGVTLLCGIAAHRERYPSKPKAVLSFLVAAHIWIAFI